MKTFQKTLQVVLFTLSTLTLILIFNQILESNYSTNRLILVMFFCLPICLSFAISLNLLLEKK